MAAPHRRQGLDQHHSAATELTQRRRYDHGPGDGVVLDLDPDPAQRRTVAPARTRLQRPAARATLADPAGRTGFRRHKSTLRSMRCLLFETISGKPASTAPPHYAPRTKDQRQTFSGFPLLLTARLAAELHLVAAEFLAGHSIDEPVSWQPPTELTDGLDLPGPTPTSCPGIC